MIPFIIGGVLLVASAIGGKIAYDKTQEKKAREDEQEGARKKMQEQAEAAYYERQEQMRTKQKRQHEANVERAKEFVTNFEALWAETISGFLLIDSNIWMSFEYRQFFTFLLEQLQKSTHVMEIPSEQFDEIVNLKDRPYDDPKSKLARCALARIEEFQNAGYLNIVPIGLGASRRAYADPVILRTLQRIANQYRRITLITDDRELRIRANQIVRSITSNIFSAEEGSTVLSGFEQYESDLIIYKRSARKEGGGEA